MSKKELRFRRSAGSGSFWKRWKLGSSSSRRREGLEEEGRVKAQHGGNHGPLSSETGITGTVAALGDEEEEEEERRVPVLVPVPDAQDPPSGTTEEEDNNNNNNNKLSACCQICNLALTESTQAQFPTTRICRSNCPQEKSLMCLECCSAYIRGQIELGNQQFRCPFCMDPAPGAMLDNALIKEAYYDYDRDGEGDGEGEGYYKTGGWRMMRARLPQFLRCEECGSYDFYPETSWKKTGGFVECATCGQAMCFVHKEKWHVGMSCAEVDRSRGIPDPPSADGEGAEWLVKHIGSRDVRKCPNPVCPAVIEKGDGGCDHLTCLLCGREFCWFCMGEWGHFHHRECVWLA